MGKVIPDARRTPEEVSSDKKWLQELEKALIENGSVRAEHPSKGTCIFIRGKKK